MDFFISYNKADLTWAEWIAWVLEEAGYTTAVQAWDFVPGTNFVLEMQRATSEAIKTIAVMSPDYLKSLYTQPEWAAAFAPDPTGSNRKLVPVVVRECDPKGLLNQIVYIKLVGLDEAGARQRLLAGLKEGRAKPVLRPSFPGAPGRSIASRPSFPGALPPIWVVPHPRNPSFTGREELLHDLREKLTSGQPAALTQAINGLGGVGKTQLAIEYAYRHASYYDAVLWVRAEEPTTLAVDFAALGNELGIYEPDTRDQEAAVKAVLRWLRENTNWLLVFDNVEEGRQIAKYMPQGTGHVLITSRNPNWWQYAEPVVVEVMEPEEAIEFLLKRPGEKDRAAAGRLAEELGYLPIALAQARAYMERKQRSLTYYLPLFLKYRDKALIPSDDYPVTLAATWGLSFEAVRQHSQAAADLLNLCSFFAPEDIPLDIIISGAEYLPESLKNTVLEPLEFDNIVEELGNYSLVEVEKGRDSGGRTISIHRLVQAVVRDRLSPKERQMWVESALKVVDSGFSFKLNDISTWSIAAMVLPHALAVTNSSDLQQPGSTEVGKLLSHLLNGLGVYLRRRAQYKDARDQITRALAVSEAVYDPGHPEVAEALSNLGKVLGELEDLAGARSSLERALAINEAQYGPDHPEVAINLNNLGRLLRELGDLQEARSCLERALAIDEATYGSGHPEVAIRLSNLGVILGELGHLQKARSYLERALAIDEAEYGPDHPEVADVLNNLGKVLGELGHLQEARSCLERALAIDEATYGPDHPSVAIKLRNLGKILRELGDPQEARSYLERALAISESAYGANHAKTLNIRRVLEPATNLDD